MSAFMLLVCTLLPQDGMRGRLQPITAPIRRAGVYHVATGTWTRGAALSDLGGPNVLYDNTCTPAYFVTMTSGEAIQHRSRLPSRSGPRTPSVFYGVSLCDPRFDEVPGCDDAYTVSGFEFAYCSSHVGAFDGQHEFASSYADCGGSDMVPQYSVLLTGLPGGTSGGAQICWTIDVDLSGLPGNGLLLSADGDGTYDGPSTADQFGWSFGIASSSVITAADFTGPLQAGNYTWTNGGTQSPCAGTDGTRYDAWQLPVHPGPGTGMSSNDFFRLTGPAVASPDCHAFGTLHSDFYLKLFGPMVCPVSDPIVKFCGGGVGGIVTCPCGNPQIPPGSTTGCDNFVAPAGGAVLAYFGNPSVSSDNMAVRMTSAVPNAVSVLFQGTTNTVNARSGAGVRCVGGTLKRISKGNAVGGSLCFQENGVPIHVASAAAGYPIVPPITLYYYAAYRNAAANGHPGCPGLDFGFNTSNAFPISWTP